MIRYDFKMLERRVGDLDKLLQRELRVPDDFSFDDLTDLLNKLDHVEAKLKQCSEQFSKSTRAPLQKIALQLITEKMLTASPDEFADLQQKCRKLNFADNKFIK